MAAHQPRTERQEVPFRACGAQHLLGVDADALEDQREFVDERDIHIALGVLDYLGGFRHFDTRRLMRSGRDDRCVQRIHEISDLRCRAGSHLLDSCQSMLLIAGIDALRTIAAEEILVKAHR